MVIELLEGKIGLVLRNKGYLVTDTAEQYTQHRIAIETPLRKNMRDRLPKNIMNFRDDKRRIIENTIGQLTKKLNIERLFARTILSFTNRLSSNILSYKLASY